MNAKTREAIIRHGRQLLAIFPRATEQDPLGLCRKLRRLETKAQAIGLQLCNGPQMAEGEQERRVEDVLARVNKLLFGNKIRHGVTVVPVFVNLDPRGYALKIDDSWMHEHNAPLHRDMGGYGILAPDLTDGE
jgi:hypothetical protein